MEMIKSKGMLGFIVIMIIITVFGAYQNKRMDMRVEMDNTSSVLQAK